MKQLFRQAGVAAGLLVFLSVIPVQYGAVQTLGVEEEPLAQKPNIVLIVTDDQRWDTLWAMPTVQNELVAKGVKFEQAFTTSPVCCPARVSIMTGLYPHTNTCTTNANCIARYNDDDTLNTRLFDAGYKTGLFGKYLNRYSSVSPYVPPKWSRWVAMKDPVYTNPIFIIDGLETPKTGYSTDLLADEAVAFLESQTSPFFLKFAPYNPHGPSTKSPLDPVSAFSDIAVYRPPSYNEADVSDKPSWIRKKELLTSTQELNGDKLVKKQLRSLLSVDRAIKRMIDTLTTNGKINNTVFIFMSDHGYMWGEHRLIDRKECPYEECLRIPLVIRAPNVMPRVENSALTLNIDIAPTLFEWAGIISPRQGKSLVPLLNNPLTPWRTDFMFELASPRFDGVRTATIKYIFHPRTGEEELYDLATDPYELQSQHANPAYSALKATLKTRLIQLR